MSPDDHCARDPLASAPWLMGPFPHWTGKNRDTYRLRMETALDLIGRHLRARREPGERS